MKYYIALGGFASRILKKFSSIHQEHICYYIDADPDTASCLDEDDRFYLVPNLWHETSYFRQVGRNAVKYEIYSGKLENFFSEIKNDNAFHEDVTIFTSSFGGFGSAAAIEVLDLLECMLFHKAGSTHYQHCRMIAFNDTFTENFHLTKDMYERHEINTCNMVSDMADKKLTGYAPLMMYNRRRHVYLPGCYFTLIDSGKYPYDQLYRILELDGEELRSLDIQNQYTIQCSFHSIRTGEK